MCQPRAQRLDEAQPAPLAGALVELLPSVAQAGSAEAGMAGKIPGRDHAPEQPAMRGKRARSAKASRVPSAQPMGSTVTTGTHTPLAQVLSAGHRLSQAPQWRGLSPRVTHWVPQSVLPLAQVAWQVPLRQTWPTAQTAPQAPQLRVSLVRLTHAPAQELVPSGQEHVPAEQVAPAGQAMAHEPQ